MSTHELAVLRQRISQEVAQSGSGRRRYSRELREAVVSYTRRRCGEGASVTAVCRELGFRQWTVRKWLRSGREAFLPVRVSREVFSPGSMTTTGAVLTAPGGYRVEGLRVEELAYLLARLCS